MKIDCSECEMYRTDHCDDCLVSVLLHPLNDTVELDEDLGEPLRNLSGAGLIPVLKFRQRAGPEAGSAPSEEGAAEAG